MIDLDMSKYDQLEIYLRDQPWNEVRMTFAEIERVMGAKLPKSAQRYRAWWSNNPSNSGLTRAWLNAGYRSEQVDLPGRETCVQANSQTRAGTAGKRNGRSNGTVWVASGKTSQNAPAARRTEGHGRD